MSHKKTKNIYKKFVFIKKHFSFKRLKQKLQKAYYKKTYFYSQNKKQIN